MPIDYSDPDHIMTAAEFEQETRFLSDDPWKRVTPHTREVLLNGRPIFDIHCHLFDIRTLNVSYFLARFFDPDKVEKLKDFLIWIGVDSPAKALVNPEYANRHSALNKRGYSPETAHEIENSWREITAGVDYALSKESEDTDRMYLNFWEVFKHLKIILSCDMEGIYRYYVSKFALTGPRYSALDLQDRTMVITALMMDLEQGWDQGVAQPRPINQVIDELKAMAETDPILPYFAVHPDRADLPGYLNLYRLFLQAFPQEERATSFFGVKVYPALGYLPSDYRLKPIFKLCEERNIPVLTHCGGTTINTDVNPLTVYRGEEAVVLTGEPEENANVLNNPGEWAAVLREFPNLRLNLAHWGSIDAWADYEGDGPTGEDSIAAAAESPQDTTRWVNVIKYFCNTYDYVYTDFAFALVDSDLYSTLKQSLDEDPADRLGKKLMYGTDFWVVIPEDNLIRGQREFLQYFEGYRERFLLNNPVRYLFGEHAGGPRT